MSVTKLRAFKSGRMISKLRTPGNAFRRAPCVSPLLLLISSADSVRSSDDQMTVIAIRSSICEKQGKGRGGGERTGHAMNVALSARKIHE